MRASWIQWAPFAIAAVSCGGDRGLVAASQDAGGSATVPLPPAISFTDEDGNFGVMGGRVTIDPAPDETANTAYEIVSSDSTRPVATLASNGGASLSYDIVVGHIAPKQLGVRAVVGGFASATTWTDGDNYLRSLPYSYFYAGPRAVALDDLGRVFIFRQGIERCDGDAPCEVLPKIVEWARDAAFDATTKRFVTVDASSVKTFDADGENVKAATFFGDLSSVALDGQGHAFVAGAGTLRCDLSTGACEPWQFAGMKVATVYTDVAHDLLIGLGSSLVRCNAAGTTCTASSTWLGHEPALDIARGLAVNAYQTVPFGYALHVCDLTTLTCEDPKVNVERGTIVAVTIDTKRDVVWMVFRDQTTSKQRSLLYRLGLDGQILSSLPLTVEMTEGHLRYDPVRDTIHIVNAAAHETIHGY